MSLGYPEQQERNQSYQGGHKNKIGALATVTDFASSGMQNTPCKKPKTETERDLCEQWRAANAAEKSAQWTVFGVIASIVGISLLLWQIMLTREAVQDTGLATIAMREANEIARRIGEAQVRCYISGVEAKAAFTPDGFVSAVCSVKNNGQSPGQKLRWSPELTLYSKDIKKILSIKPFARDAYYEIVIAAGAVEELDFVNFKLDVGNVDFTAITNENRLFIRIDANIVAEDVFGIPVKIEDGFTSLVTSNPYGLGWVNLMRSANIMLNEAT